MAAISVTATNRVIALVDMDCFYVQVEERDDPSIKGVPAAVVQYKAYKGGGIIAVNYEARAKGVTRNMRGDDAKAVCPEIVLVRVPETRGKADLTKYRDAGREVINVLTEFSDCVERASIDEAYIDLTETVENRLSEISSEDMFVSYGESVLQMLNEENLKTNYVLGYDSTNSWFEAIKGSEMPSLDDIKLAIGAEIVGKMREAVYQKTAFRCSAGIAHNKVLAKLVCGINKPNKQTVLPHPSVSTLWATTKIGKVRGLGGKLGDYLIEKLQCTFMGDLSKFTERDLHSELGPKMGTWIYQLAKGLDDEPVTARQLPKSIGCNKNFQGPEALRTKEKSKFWINQLAAEVVERIQRDLEMNNRRAKLLTLHVKFENQNALSRSCGANPSYNAERMAADAFATLEKLYQLVGILPINSLGLIASKFEDEIDTSYGKINNFFKTKTDEGKSKNTMEKSSFSIETNGSSSFSLTSTTISKQSDVLPSNETSLKPDCSMPSTSKSLSTLSSINQTSATPKKSNPGELTDQRKPLFTFSETAPKLISPRKSPRKLTIFERNGQNLINPQTVEKSAQQSCERCGKNISHKEYASHMDYHFAKDLSRELNGLPALGFDLRTETVKKKPDEEATTNRFALKRQRGRGSSSSAGSSKRGRGAKSQTSTVSRQKINTIDSYFAPKS